MGYTVLEMDPEPEVVKKSVFLLLESNFYDDNHRSFFFEKYTLFPKLFTHHSLLSTYGHYLSEQSF